jgi:hypothetical protein
MTRKTHLVGTWPGEFGVHAMETAFQRLGPHLERMTDGETGDRSQWIRPTIEWLRANPDVERVLDGKGSTDDVPLYRVRDGHSLRPERIELGYLRAFEQSYPAFRVLRERHGHGHVSFQVGVPAPLDLATVIFGSAAAAEYAPAFAARTLEQIAEIRRQAGDDVIFQIESVVALVAVAQGSAEPQRMAEALASLAADAPEGTRWGAHLCLGDYRHKATGHAADARPLVQLANELARAWPAGRPLEYVHGPFAAADEPPSFDEAWYEPLRALDLPDGVRFVAGFIHEDVETARLAELLATIERLAGREVDVAAACGLGRRPSPDEAWDAMDKAARLVDA